jgi:cysteine desulfurase
MTLCYFDANATTFMPEIVVKTMLKWINKGNPSAHYKSALEGRTLMKTFRDEILSNNNLDNHTLIFTSGASESNATILTSSVRSYMVKTGHLPHVIISEVEHKSIISCCEDLKEDGMCIYTKIKVSTNNDETYGMVDPEELEKAIRPNTCLISIMTANNETGIINDIPSLAAVAHKYKIPFHTDCVQMFGKYGLYEGVDAASISFHKLGGPPGIGCLIIRNNFIQGYNLKALIAGPQNNGLRGGTENIPYIAASYAAYKFNNLQRNEKNEYLLNMKHMLQSFICKYLECRNIGEYSPDSTAMVYFISNIEDSKSLPNTILLAISKPNFCNIKFRNLLAENNIIVSIGSACNASSLRYSNVVISLNIPNELLSGVIRISLPDDVTKDQIKYFASVFIKLLS